mgnify:CR=1 FL=1
MKSQPLEAKCKSALMLYRVYAKAAGTKGAGGK